MKEQVQRTYSILDEIFNISEFYSLEDYKKDYTYVFNKKKQVLNQIYKTSDFQQIKQAYELNIQDIEIFEDNNEEQIKSAILSFFSIFSKSKVTIHLEKDDLFSLLHKVKNNNKEKYISDNILNYIRNDVKRGNSSLEPESEKKILTYVKISEQSSDINMEQLIKYLILVGYVNNISKFFFTESIYNQFNKSYSKWIKYYSFNDCYKFINTGKYIPNDSYMQYKNGLSISGLNTIIILRTGVKLLMLKNLNLPNINSLELELLGDIIFEKVSRINPDLEVLTTQLYDLMSKSENDLNQIIFKSLCNIR